MATQAAAPAKSPPLTWWRQIPSSLGPGLVFVLGTLGARDLVSNSIAGASSGGGVFWALLLAFLTRYVLLDASGRYVLVTGKSLLGGIGEKSRWMTWLYLPVALLRRHTQSLVRLLLLGTAAHVVLPLPTRHSTAIWGIASWTAAFLLLYWGRYKAVEGFSKWISALLGVLMLLAAILSKPDVGAFAASVFHPTIPPEEAGHSPWLVLIAVISGAVGSFSNLKYSAVVHEKGWRSTSFLRTQRLDLAASMAGMLVMLLLVQMAAAGALQPHGAQIKKIDDLVPLFGAVLGDAGRIVFGVMLWCIIFAQHLSSSSANGIIVSDLYHRFVRPSPLLLENARTPGDMPAYRWLIVYVSLSPLYVFATGWSPVAVILIMGLLSMATLPLMSLLVLRMTASRRIMGEYVNGWFTNAVLALSMVGALYLSYEAGLDMMKEIKRP